MSRRASCSPYNGTYSHLIIIYMRKLSNFASKIRSKCQLRPFVALIWEKDLFSLTFNATIADRNPIIVVKPAGESQYVSVIVNPVVMVGFSPSQIKANDKAIEI